MDASRILGREMELFRFMKDNGFPVFHKSNMFLRDVQYGIRDFFRSTERIDIGSRTADQLAHALVTDLESRGVFLPFANNTWILNLEEFLNAPKQEATAEATEA